jgi:hypothetical protein
MQDIANYRISMNSGVCRFYGTDRTPDFPTIFFEVFTGFFVAFTGLKVAGHKADQGVLMEGFYFADC